MATRIERVILDVEDRATQKFARAAAAAKLLSGALDDLDGTSTGASKGLDDVTDSADGAAKSSDAAAKNTKQYTLEMALAQEKAARLKKELRDQARAQLDAANGIKEAAGSARDGGRELDRYSGRLRAVTDAAVTLGPLLIPLGASTIPALTGALAGLGAAGAGLATTVLAFHGLSDGVKALQSYNLAPTVENLAKLREEAQKLGPAGFQFAQYIDDLEPKLRGLQNVARNGLFPQLEGSIDNLLMRMPEFRRFVQDISIGLGNLASDTSTDLTSSDWSTFFDYVRTDARPTMEAFAASAGNVANGLANMLAAFAPVTRDFTGGLESMTDRFAAWTAGLQDSADFEAFLDYIRESGPEAIELLGSLSSALVSILQAAAPLGQVTLPVLTSLADLLSTIADSPAGPALVTAAAAMTVFSRASKVAAASTGKLQGALYGLSTRNVVGGLGLLAASMTDVDDNMGLANTTMLSMAGLMVGGPWGAAIGGGIGLMKDFSAGGDDAGKALRRFDAALGANSTNLSSYKSILDDARAQLDSMDDVVPTGFGDQLVSAINPANIKLNFKALFGDLDDSDLGKQATEVAQLNTQYMDLITTAQIVGQTIGAIGVGEVGTMEDLTGVLTRVQPAMAALGISTEDLMAAMRDGSILELTGHLKDWMATADSSQGRTDAVAVAVANLSKEFLTTSQSASQLSDALNALLSPQLDLSEATDAWTTAVRHLSEDLDKNNKTLNGNSDAAITNRAAIRDRVQAMTDVLNAEAAAGAGSARLSKTLQRQRGDLLAAGEAAGISRRDMRSYLNTLGLTPELVQTLISTNAPKTEEDVRGVGDALDDVDGKSAEADVRVDPGNSLGLIGTIESALTDLNGTTAKTYIETYRSTHGGTLQGQKDNPAITGGDSGRVAAGRRGALDKMSSQTGPGLVGPLSRSTSGDPFTAGSTFIIGAFHALGEASTNLKDKLKRLEDAVEKQKKQVEAARGVRDAAVARRDALSGSIQQGLAADPWAEVPGRDAQPGSSNPWAPGAIGAVAGTEATPGTPASALAALQASTARARRLVAALNELKRKGITGPVLSEIIGTGDVERAEMMAALDVGTLTQFSGAYAENQQALAAAGLAGGNAVEGANIHTAKKELQQQIKELKQLQTDVRAVEQAINRQGEKNRDNRDKNTDRGAEETARQTGAEVKSAAGKGKRDRVYGSRGTGGRRH